MEDDFTTEIDIQIKNEHKQIKEEPCKDDHVANQLFLNYPNTLETTEIKEELDKSIKEEPFTDEYGTSSEAIIPTEFIDVGQPKFEKRDIKTEEECESDMQGTSLDK